MRVLLVATFGPAALVTPTAYVLLFAYVFSPIEAHYNQMSVALCLSAVSLAALFGLWRLWSIGKRLWSHSTYVPPSKGAEEKTRLVSSRDGVL